MHDRDFEKALRDADAAHGERTLPADAERRIRGRLDARWEQRARAGWLLRVPVLVAATAVVAIAVFVSWPRGASEIADEVSAFRVREGDAAHVIAQTDGSVRIEGARVQLVLPQARIELGASPGAQMQTTATGVRILRGEITVSVARRAADEAPAVIEVSHGAIEVLGTRFTVAQGPGGGEVTLHEGRIRFRGSDGGSAELRVGQTLRWPLPAVDDVPGGGERTQADRDDDAASASASGESHVASPPASAVEVARPPDGGRSRSTMPGAKTAKSPRSKAADPSDVEGLIRDITVMRRRGQFAEAALRLEHALQSPLPAHTAERLSFELGSILTWQLKDARRGCAVWTAHRAAHPNGRYDAEITRAEATLGCTTD